jgi:hypothetical protein
MRRAYVHAFSEHRRHLRFSGRVETIDFRGTWWVFECRKKSLRVIMFHLHARPDRVYAYCVQQTALQQTVPAETISHARIRTSPARSNLIETTRRTSSPWYTRPPSNCTEKPSSPTHDHRSQPPSARAQPARDLAGFRAETPRDRDLPLLLQCDSAPHVPACAEFKSGTALLPAADLGPGDDASDE